MQRECLCISGEVCGLWIVLGLGDSSLEMISMSKCHSVFLLYGQRYPAIGVDLKYVDGLVASCGVSPVLFIWRTHRFRAREALLVHRGPIYKVNLLAGVKMSITVGGDRSLRVTDFCERTLVAVVESNYGVITSLFSCRNGTYLLAGGADRVVRMFVRTSNLDLPLFSNVFHAGSQGPRMESQMKAMDLTRFVQRVVEGSLAMSWSCGMNRYRITFYGLCL